jgi:hypothetical protein
MTQPTIRANERNSQVNEYVAGALTIAVLALSAVVLFSQLVT